MRERARERAQDFATRDEAALHKCDREHNLKLEAALASRDRDYEEELEATLLRIGTLTDKK